jgi:hypothetical protein
MALQRQDGRRGQPEHGARALEPLRHGDPHRDMRRLQQGAGNHAVVRLLRQLGHGPVGIYRRTKQPSGWVQPLLDIAPTNRWNDKELGRLIMTLSVPLDEVLAYVGRMVGLDRRLAELDLSFAHRAYDAAIARIYAGAGELTRFGIPDDDIATARPYFELLKERRYRIEQALMTLYASDAALAASPLVNAPQDGWGKSPPASLLQGTHEISDSDRRELTSTLRPAPIAPLFGEPPKLEALKFDPHPPGVAKDFRGRVRERAELMIQEGTQLYVTGKGEAQRASVTPWQRYQQIANAAKDAVDATFGAYAQRKAFVAGVNLRDVWEEVGKEQAGLGWPERTGAAMGQLNAMSRMDGELRAIEQEHHFMAGRAPEQGILDAVLDDVARRHVPELLAIDRGWPATQDDKKHTVNIQRWRVDDTSGSAHTAQRRAFWDVFQTIIHEYIHALEDSRYSTFVKKQPGDILKVLTEGVTSVLTEVAWSNVDPANQLLRNAVEGEEVAQLPFDAATVPDIADQRYEEYGRALAMVGIVGLPNVYAAYFLGRTELIRHAGAR